MSFNNFSSDIKLNNIKAYSGVNTATNDAFKKQVYSDIEEIDYGSYEEVDYNAIDLQEGIEKAEASKNQKEWYEEIIDLDKKLKATACVTATSVASGVLKIGEYAADGLTWLGGMAVSGVARLFGQKEFAEDFEEMTMDEIARDKVGEMNEFFYENTELGKAINDASALKYNSELAKGIQNVTTEAAIIVGATAATVVTGGAAAPLFAAGFVVGAGQSAEKKYQDVENRDFWKDSVEIAVDGTIKGLSTVAYGKAGAAAVNGVKTLGKLGLSGVKEMGKQAISSVSKESLKQTAKQSGKIALKTAGQTLIDKDTWRETGAVLLNDIKTGVQTGEWDVLKMVGDAALIYGENYIGNLAGNVVGDAISGTKTYDDNPTSLKKQMEPTSFNSYKDDLLKTMPKKLNGEEKAKYLYNKLNQELSYSPEYFLTKNPELYDSSVNLENLTEKNVVCSTWAEAYQKLLNEVGIDSQIMGSEGGHRWVSFQTNGKYYIADATQPYNGMTDLTNAKAGTSSGGFVQVTKELALSNEACKKSNIGFIKGLSEQYSITSQKIDANIGFNNKTVTDLFSENKLAADSLFDAANGNTYGELAQKKFELLLEQTNGMGTMETVGYVQVMNNVMSPQERSLITRFIPTGTVDASKGYIGYSIELQNGQVAEYIVDMHGNWTVDTVEVLK